MNTQLTYPLIMLCAWCLGCADDLDNDRTEQVAAATSALVVGNWAGYFQNDNAGPNPVTWTQDDGIAVPLCEALGPDTRFHPGKLFLGTCRYAYGSGVRYASTYKVMQWPATWYFPYHSPGGSTPSNTYSGECPYGGTNCDLGLNLALGVCWTGRGWGKVWQGNCEYEYGGARQVASSFWFFARYPN